MGDSPIGFALGFAYGLQYSPDEYGECYINLRTTIVGIDTVWQKMYMIFLPDQWGDWLVSW